MAEGDAAAVIRASVHRQSEALVSGDDVLTDLGAAGYVLVSRSTAEAMRATLDGGVRMSGEGDRWLTR